MALQNKSPTRALEQGLEGHATRVVTADQTGPAVGSGKVAVYSTPSLVALMENAAVECVESRLAPGEATLGVRLEVSHTAATPPGMEVSATATLTQIDGRKLTFSIVARDAVEPIGKATHIRIIVDAARFKAKLAAKFS